MPDPKRHWRRQLSTLLDGLPGYVVYPTLRLMWLISSSSRRLWSVAREHHNARSSSVDNVVPQKSEPRNMPTTSCAKALAIKCHRSRSFRQREGAELNDEQVRSNNEARHTCIAEHCCGAGRMVMVVWITSSSSNPCSGSTWCSSDTGRCFATASIVLCRQREVPSAVHRGQWIMVSTLLKADSLEAQIRIIPVPNFTQTTIETFEAGACSIRDCR